MSKRRKESMLTAIDLSSHKEWETWQKLVSLLRQTKAVTEEDCNSPVTANKTVGQNLFQAIREWGEALVALRQLARISQLEDALKGALAFMSGEDPHTCDMCGGQTDGLEFHPKCVCFPLRQALKRN